MPLHVWIDPTRRLVAARGVGTVSDGDVFNYQSGVWSRTDVIGFDELVDISDADDVHVSAPGRAEDLARIASGMDGWEAPSRLAVVAPGDAAFRLAQGYGELRERMARGQKRVAAFRTRAEAESWLGLPAGAIAELFATPPTLSPSTAR